MTRGGCGMLAALLGAAFLATAQPCAGEEAPSKGADDAAALEALLRELRELRTAMHREEAAWKVEEKEMQAIVAQRRARLDAAEKRRAALQKRADEADAALKAKKEKLEALRKQADEWRKWMKEAVATIEKDLARMPFLKESLDGRSKDGAVERLRKAADEKQRLADSVVQFWNALLATGVKGVEADVRTEQIDVGGISREASVLRLGGVGALYATGDGSSCGMASSREGKIVWEELPRAWLDGVRRAIRVGRKDVAAELVIFPFPRSAIESGDKVR